MATYIKTLKEDNGDVTYPQTVADAVRTTKGTTVQTILDQTVTAEEIAQTVTAEGSVTTNMIANGAVTAGKLADGAVTASKLEDTGWVTCPYKSGYKASTNTGFRNSIRARIIGGVFYIQGAVSPNSGNFTANSEVAVADVPSSLLNRLTYPYIQRGYLSGGGASAGFANIALDGRVIINPNAATAWTSFNYSFPID